MKTIGDWSVMLSVSARDDSTEADARLPMGGGTDLTGHGTARRNPADQNVTKIGEELAVARALSDLAHRLLRVATADVETVTHGRAHLHM
jgi:Domain of unknown function (DUF1876)